MENPEEGNHPTCKEEVKQNGLKIMNYLPHCSQNAHFILYHQQEDNHHPLTPARHQSSKRKSSAGSKAKLEKRGLSLRDPHITYDSLLPTCYSLTYFLDTFTHSSWKFKIPVKHSQRHYLLLHVRNTLRTYNSPSCHSTFLW